MPGTDDVLRQIASGTLGTTLSQGQLDTFVTAVKSRAIAAFVVAYQGIGVQLVNADGPDVHTISVLTNSGQIYGQSPLDFGNNVAKQTSEIWLGTYRDLMIGNHISDWSPMQRSDSLAMRIIDVGEAMGRTCAHEFGHSLGLIASGSAATGGWMLGCDGGHNCDQVDILHPPAHRFGQGFFIMDPGNKTLNNARIAEASPTGRSPTRKPAVFNNFNRSYFAFVQPSP